MTKRPNLFVLGFQKCGTTLLTDLLGSHEQVFVPSIKETYFFIDDSQFERGYPWYFNEYFAPAGEHHKWVGEGTPFYACDRTAMERLCAHTDVSAAKFILALRDPVKRAYSAYWHIRRLGHEDLSFEEALAAEPERIREAERRGQRWWRHAYKTVSSYGSHLAMVQEFIPAENLLILVDEDLRDPLALRQQLAGFLEIDPHAFGEVSESNKASMPRHRWIQDAIIGNNPLKSVVRKFVPREQRARFAKSILKANSTDLMYPAISAQTAAELRAVLAPEIKRAAELTGRDLSGWL
jgi:hypothetical protein